MNKIKKLLTSSTMMLLISGLVGFSAPALVLAAPADDACTGIRAAGGSCDAASGESQFGGLVRTVISALSIVVGAVSVIMIIVGGFRYVISGGDSNATSGAKNTIMYAVIGLIVVLFAQVIVSFVFSNAREGATTCPSNPDIAANDPACNP